jgi:hypothetical protein
MSGSVDPEGSSLNFDPGQVYYFVNPEIGTPEPHYHICLEQAGGGVLFMVCCTSQFEKRRQYIERTGLPMTTLVWMSPDENNKFKKDTYVDCNSCFEFNVSEIPEFDAFKHIGRIKPTHIEEIAGGIVDSPKVEDYKKDIVKKLLEF